MVSEKDFINAEQFLRTEGMPLKGVNDNTGSLAQKVLGGASSSLFPKGSSFIIGIFLFIVFLFALLYFM